MIRDPTASIFYVRYLRHGPYLCEGSRRHEHSPLHRKLHMSPPKPSALLLLSPLKSLYGSALPRENEVSYRPREARNKPCSVESGSPSTYIIPGLRLESSAPHLVSERRRTVV